MLSQQVTLPLTETVRPPARVASERGCCRRAGKLSGAGASTRPRNVRGVWDLAAGAGSLGIWILVPKCPLCLAAHLALWTGLGLSLTAATYLRLGLLCVSAVLLFYFVVKVVVRQFPMQACGE
jgi:hypothetical protein